jgi:putative addiction module component (TIGR02574 family)
MSSILHELGIDRLSLAERIELVQELWDSIADEAEQSGLSDELKSEIDARLARHEANPGAAVPWEQVEAEALARLRR